MGINQLDVELKQLRQQKRDNHNQQREMDRKCKDECSTLEMRRSYLDKWTHLIMEADKVYDAIKENQSYYRRPSGKITGLFTRVLGPLPSGLKDTDIDKDAEEVMASLPSYRFAAFGLLLGVITILITMSAMFPWLMISPLTLFMSATSVEQSIQPIVITVIVLVIVTLIVIAAFRAPAATRRFVYTAAHEEEKWFRSGAENWTPWQRIISCLSFGFCHVINIIYPFLTLAVLSLAGMAFMVAYLREYQRSNDTYRATLAATKLHARYNIYAVWVVCAVLVSATLVLLL